MLYIVVRNSLNAEINRIETDEANLDAAMQRMVRENLFAVGDSITIEEA